jgi:hypothetical protein
MPLRFPTVVANCRVRRCSTFDRPRYQRHLRAGPPDAGPRSALLARLADSNRGGTTAVTATELRYGVAWLPAGHRKRELTAAIRGLLTEDFHGRVLPFDGRASVRIADFEETGIELVNPWNRTNH